MGRVLSPACGRGEAELSRAGRRCGASAASGLRRALSRLGTHPGRHGRSHCPRASGAWPGPPLGMRPLPLPTAGSPPGHPSSRVCGSVDGGADGPKGRAAGWGWIGQNCCPPRLASARRSPASPKGRSARRNESLQLGWLSLSRPVCPKPALSSSAQFCSVVFSLLSR